MTKMTVLHFASPFAFSMPLPVRVSPPDRGSDDARAPVAVTESSSVRMMFSFASRAAVAEEATSTLFETAGHEASLYETVLQRYCEQIAAGSGAPATEAADRSSA